MQERRAQVETQVDGQLGGRAPLGQTAERRHRLLQEEHRLPVRGAARGLDAGLPQVRHRLLPHLAAHRVVGEPLEVLGQPVGVEMLDGLDHPRVERAAAILEQARVGHLVGEGVPERVLHVREEADLVQELAGLQQAQVAPHRLLAHVRDLLQERERDVLADHGGGLQEALGLDGQAVDAGGQDRLHGGRHLHLLDFAGEAVVAARAREHLGLGEGVHALLEEERVALGALDQELLQRAQARIVAQQRAQ